MISWPHALGQNIIVERIWQRKKFTSWWIESRETDTGTGGQRPGYNLQRHAPNEPGLISQSFHNLTKQWRPSIQHISLWGALHIQSITMFVWS
jgi:hypothetical protein